MNFRELKHTLPLPARRGANSVDRHEPPQFVEPVLDHDDLR